MKVLKKIELEAISFCIKYSPANKLKILISKSDKDTEQDRIDELDDILAGVDSLTNQLNEGIQIVESKVNPEAMEGIRRDVASTLGISMQKSEKAIDHYPSMYILKKGEIIDEEKIEDNHEEIEEEEPESAEEFLALCKDRNTAQKLLEKGMSKESIIEIVGTRGVKKSLSSDDDGGLDNEEEETEELSKQEKALRALGERVFTW